MPVRNVRAHEVWNFKAEPPRPPTAPNSFVVFNTPIPGGAGVIVANCNFEIVRQSPSAKPPVVYRQTHTLTAAHATAVTGIRIIRDVPAQGVLEEIRNLGTRSITVEWS